MKKKTAHIRKYPKKWSKDRKKFENRKRDHNPKKIKEFINHYCETCKKDLKTRKEWKECFQKNHTIRTRGQFVVKSQNKQYHSNIPLGIVKEDYKKGEIVEIQL